MYIVARHTPPGGVLEACQDDVSGMLRMDCVSESALVVGRGFIRLINVLLPCASSSYNHHQFLSSRNNSTRIPLHSLDHPQSYP